MKVLDVNLRVSRLRVLVQNSYIGNDTAKPPKKNTDYELHV